KAVVVNRTYHFQHTERAPWLCIRAGLGLKARFYPLCAIRENNIHYNHFPRLRTNSPIHRANITYNNPRFVNSLTIHYDHHEKKYSRKGDRKSTRLNSSHVSFSYI